MERATPARIRALIEETGSSIARKHAEFHAGKIVEFFCGKLDDVYMEDLLLINDRVYFKIYNCRG